MDVPETIRSLPRDILKSCVARPEPDAAALRELITAKLTYSLGCDPLAATERDWLVAAVLAVRDRIVDRWLAGARNDRLRHRKHVCYLSMEFLLGRLFADSVNNLGLTEPMRAALSSLGVDFDRLRSLESDPALGNGGLGRLAACFMESMASLGIPAHGFGIRYDHGMFEQEIRDGWQHEHPESWLELGNPWEFERRDISYAIGFGGGVETLGSDRTTASNWQPQETVVAVAFDMPVVGWRGRHVNTLRLWSARALDPLALEAFNQGDHVGALAARAQASAISQILYPSDDTPAGQELRLRQEYFLTSASLQDLLARHIRQHGDVRSLADKCAIQLNDTHPAIAVPELMRLLVDQHGISWAEAWQITTATISYTNHTLLPEALESWAVPLMERLLPRHMQIIFEINKLHLDALAASGRLDAPPLHEVSVIDEAAGQRVRMGTLAFLGSHKVNGVSALHSELMRQTVFRPLHRLYPERIVNKTNGITFRRWLFTANPGLTNLLQDAIGPEVLDDPMVLERLAPMADDTALHDRLISARRHNKVALATLIRDQLDVAIDPSALVDVQIKRVHEYKRQLLNILETVALYYAIRAEPHRDWVPRVKLFAGRAAASYKRAKLIIKLIHDVARLVNNDPVVGDRLKVVFLPDYNVSLAEVIIPAADLSEQISTAGMEASGTGNMKLALNGALTIGTLDGANLEILDRVGEENMFIFGLTTQEVEECRRRPPARRFSSAMQQVLDALGSGAFSPGEPDRYRELVADLMGADWFMVTADFDSYLDAQYAVSARWRDQQGWWRSSVLNTANMGWFSSDRTIREYAADIWRVPVAAD